MSGEDDRLLADDPWMTFQPAAAVLLGASEAILLQQIHWLILHRFRDDRMPIRDYEGRRYRRIPPEVLREHFPFWEHRNIQRMVAELRGLGVLFTENLNDPQSDNTLWYATDKARLNQLRTSGEVKRKKPGRPPKTNSSDHAIITSRPAQSLRSGSETIAPPIRIGTKKEEQKEQQQAASPVAPVGGVVGSDELLSRLLGHGVARPTAMKLVVECPDEVARQLANLPRQRNVREPDRWLVKAIREGYRSAQDRQAAQDAAEAVAATERAAKARDRQAAQREIHRAAYDKVWNGFGASYRKDIEKGGRDRYAYIETYHANELRDAMG